MSYDSTTSCIFEPDEKKYRKTQSHSCCVMVASWRGVRVIFFALESSAIPIAILAVDSDTYIDTIQAEALSTGQP